MMSVRIAAAAMATIALAGVLEAQSLIDRAQTLGEGTIRFSFAAREGICGRGEGQVTITRRNEEWEGDCEPGPVRIAAQVANGQITALRSYVGGRWRGVSGPHTDLGLVGVRQAVDWLQELALSSVTIRGDPVFPITLADSLTPWETILQIARSPIPPTDRRRSALFWLGQAAGAEATKDLEAIATSEEDRRLREQAVFALSQIRDDAGIPALIRLARTNGDPRVRRSAFFWLGQSEDPRALALFEAILISR